MKKKRDEQPIDLSKSGDKSIRSGYQDALDMVLLEKSQGELEQEVALSEIEELQAKVEELKKKVLDLNAAEKSLKKLLGTLEEEEGVITAPVPLQPIAIPFPPYVPNNPPCLPSNPWDTGQGWIWTSPYTTSSGGTLPNLVPIIPFNNGHGDMAFSAPASSIVYYTGDLKDLTDAMIFSGHMTWQTGNNFSAGG